MTPEERARRLVPITQAGIGEVGDDLHVEGRVYIAVGDAFTDDDSYGPGMVEFGKDLRRVIAAEIASAVAEEREACAKVAEDTNDCCECDEEVCCKRTQCPTAAAIRARP